MHYTIPFIRNVSDKCRETESRWVVARGVGSDCLTGLGSPFGVMEMSWN